MWANEAPERLAKLFELTKTIAVVGLSSNPWRTSHSVAEYLQQEGFRIIPVNPNETEVLGEKAYATLEDVPDAIDIVDIFRRSEFVRPLVESAMRVGAKAVWMQETVEDAAAGQMARDAGLAVMMDNCILKEHSRWKRER